MSMRPNRTNLPTQALPRQVVTSYERYEEAQAAVDRLSDDGFPVEHLAVVGTDLRLVEQVTGRLNLWRAALAGAGSGAFLGAMLGLLFGLFLPEDADVSVLGLMLYWLVVGAVVGAVLGALAHALTGGRRDFSSVTGIQAGRYDLLAADEVVDDARRRLGVT